MCCLKDSWLLSQGLKQMSNPQILQQLQADITDEGQETHLHKNEEAREPYSRRQDYPTALRNV